jgi:hypothetical protein
MADKEKLVGFRMSENKFRRLKAIAVIQNRPVQEIFKELADDYIEKFSKEDLGKKFMALPIEERLHRVVGQELDLSDMKRGKK